MLRYKNSLLERILLEKGEPAMPSSQERGWLDADGATG